MKAKERRELYKKEGQTRHQENYANKDNSGRFSDMFEATKKVGVKFWKCKEDDHEVYIVPYIVGNQHPRLKTGKADFVLDVFVHRKVGINEDSFICLNRTYKKDCPICEYQAELRESNDADDVAIKALNPTRRNVFNIICMDSPKEEEKGVQVWDVSQWLFTNPLEELAHKKRGGGEVAYADIDEGKIISFRKKGSGMTNTEYTAFEFKDRPEIPDEILDAAVCLDELLHVPEYDEIKEAFFQTKDEQPAEKETSGKKEEKDTEKPSAKKTKEDDVHTDDVVVEECPYGAEFGKDFNEYEECRQCEARQVCRVKKDELTDKEEKPIEKKKVLTRRGK